MAKPVEDNTIEEAMMAKVRDSQQALLAAATSTADAAHDVTTLLKRRLDDGIRQIEVTSKLLHDALIVCKPDGTIITFNRAAEIIFGWSASQIIGQCISNLFVREDGSKLSMDDILFILTAQSPLDGSELYDDHIELIRGKLKNGNTIWVDGNVSQFERQDGSTLILFLIKDVSKIMAVQQLLLEQESRYRGIFEQSFDGIMVVDNHHVVAVNPAMTCILGYLEEEMIAKPVRNFITAEYQELVTASHNRRIQGDESPHNYLVKVTKADGECVDVLVSSTMILWDGRRSSLLTLKDLTKINS
jgi:PAS domain S-box-containing protein